MIRNLLGFMMPKICQTSILTTTLVLWIQQRKGSYKALVFSNIVFSLIVQAILTVVSTLKNSMFITIQQQQNIHFALSTLLLINTTKIGIDILFSKPDFSIISFMLLPVCFILDQGLYVQDYIIKYKKVHSHTVSNTDILSTVAIGFLLYAVLSGCYYFIMTVILNNKPRIRKCFHSIPLCFTGAILLSKLFGYLQLNARQSNLLESMRYYQTDKYSTIRHILNYSIGFKEFNYETTNWISTGYGIYWFFISSFLIYKNIKQN